MLTYKQIAQAITARLQTQFPNVTVLQEDIQEGAGSTGAGFSFIRPSFKVLLDSNTRDERQYNSKRFTTCRIYFFPTDLYNYSMEFLDTLDGLEAAFNLNLQCQDRTITIPETRNQEIGEATQTKVLEFDFDLQWYDDSLNPQPTTNYKMGNLDINIGE